MGPTFPDIRLPHLEGVELPALHRVRLRHPDLPALDDIEAAIVGGLSRSARLAALSPGASVAVAVGSRGIVDIDRVARCTVDWLKAGGHAPFIVPAMGSHGGGTAEGQTAVLERLGVSEATMGCPVRSSMETVGYGHLPDGSRCRFDARAAAADGVVVINRVKAHTSFPRPVESGLTKMLAVGLGKAEGARQVHRIGPPGYTDVLPRLAERIAERAPLAAGIALVENARKQLAIVEVCEPQDFAKVDARLLVRSKAAMARLPFARLDGLIVERVGKDVSGAGIDPAVCGRTNIRGVADPEMPFVAKIAVMGLTEATHGNGIGVGLADFIPRHVAEALDLHAMYMNAVTATVVEKAFIPIVLPDDATVLRALVATCWAGDAAHPRIARIVSSSRLEEIAVTPALLPELEGGGHEIDRAAEPIAFADGRLVPLAR